MNPKLLVVTGGLEGGIYPVAITPFSIGRDPQNRFCLSDSSVSQIGKVTDHEPETPSGDWRTGGWNLSGRHHALQHRTRSAEPFLPFGLFRVSDRKSNGP